MLYSLFSVVILIAVYMLYKKHYDIFTDKGSLRKLISPLNFSLVILILVIAQLSFASIIFYIFVPYFNTMITFEQAIFAGAVTALFYSTSFLIFKYYGPYIMFSFDKGRRSERHRNSLLLLLWLLVISFTEGIIFNELLGIEFIASIFTSCFAISVIAFLAT